MSSQPPAGRTRRAVLAGAGLAAAATPTLATGQSRGPAQEYDFEPGLTYLNTASLGPTRRSIRALMDEVSDEVESNPVFQSYGAGPALARSDEARKTLGAFLGCAADDLLITRSTTDAMNTLAAGMKLVSGDRVLTTDQEHEGATHCWTNLARRRGVVLDVIPIAAEDQDPAAIVARFEQGIGPATKVISVSHVISSTGHRMPVEQIAALARSRGVFCVVDGAQAVGQIPVDVKAVGCDAYAAAGHKWLMGPKGTGMLYLDPAARDRVEAVQFEDGPRFVSNAVGIGNLPLAIGLGAAAASMSTRGMANVLAHNLALRNRAYEGLKSVPGLRMVGAAPGDPMATAMVAAELPAAADSRAFRDRMRLEHQVIVKMAEKRWFNGFRLSPHVFNTQADIDRALAAIRQVLA